MSQEGKKRCIDRDSGIWLREIGQTMQKLKGSVGVDGRIQDAAEKDKRYKVSSSLEKEG